jgi:hypothetical protein
MAKLTEYTRYADAQKFADSQALWELFDGNREAPQHRARVHRPARGRIGPRRGAHRARRRHRHAS